MGFFDFLGDIGSKVLSPALGFLGGGPLGAFLGAFGSGFGGTKSTGNSDWSSLWPALGGALGSSAFDLASGLGADWLSNELIGKPNSAYAWNQSEAAANLAYDRGKEAATKAYQRERRAYQHRYQWTMDDMTAAGLNPILAAGGGFNVGGGVDASMPNIPMATGPQPIAPTSSASALHMAQSQLAKEEKEKTKESTQLIRRQAMTEIQQLAKVRAETGAITAKEKETIQNIYNLEQQHVKMAKEIMVLANQSSLQAVEKDKLEEQIQQIKTINQKLTYELNQLKNISTVYGTPVGRFLTVVSETLGSIGSILGGLKR